MKRKKKSRVFILITLCVLGYFTYLMIGQEQIIREKNRQIAGINQKIDDEKDKNAELKKQRNRSTAPNILRR